MVSCFSPPFCLGKEVSLARLSPFTLSPNVKGGIVALLINKLCKKVMNIQKSIEFTKVIKTKIHCTNLHRKMNIVKDNMT